MRGIHQRKGALPTRAAGATNTNTYTGRADQAKILFRHSKKIDGDYDNDNRSACAPLTTTELQASKGRGGDGGTTEH
jgi:hypothetical protein